MTPAQVMQLERLGLLRVRPRHSRARHTPPAETSLAPPSQTTALLKAVPRPSPLAVVQRPVVPLKRPTRPTSYWDTEITRCIRNGIDPRRISVDPNGDLLILQGESPLA
jgi:hypothetical protein